jgi:hypothetical protein
MATLLRATVGQHPSTTSIVHVSAVAMTFGFGFFASVATSIALRAAAAVVGRRLPSVACAVCVIVASCTITVITLSVIHRPGFFSEEAALVGFLAILSLLIDVRRPSVTVTVVAACLAVAITQTWYLLTPTLVPLGWRYLKMTSRRSLAGHGLVLVMASPFIGFPVVTGPRPSDQLVAIGVTPFVASLTLVGLLIMTVGGVLALKHQPVDPQATGWLVAALSSVGALAIAVLGYQLYSHALGYYTAKAVMVFLIFGALLGTTGIGVSLTRTINATNVVLAAWTLLATALVSAGTWGPLRSELTQDGYQRVAAREASVFLDRHPYPLARGVYAFAADGCRPDPFLSQAFANVGATWDPAAIDVEDALFVSNTIDPLVRLARSDATRRIEVYGMRGCRTGLPVELRHLPNVVTVDATR